MTKRIICVFILLLVGASIAIAQKLEVRTVEARANEILPFVSEQTGYNITNVHPTFHLATTERINRMYYLSNYSGQTDILAVTLLDHIYLPVWYRIGEDDHILAHELTIVAQYANGASFRCSNARETEAYRVQAAYLKKMGRENEPSYEGATLLGSVLICMPNGMPGSIIWKNTWNKKPPQE